MQEAEISRAYEENTGHAIVKIFRDLDYEAVPAVLVANHGPFAWGVDAKAAAHNSAMLEQTRRRRTLP